MHQKMVLLYKESVRYTLAHTAGAVFGALFAVQIGDATFKKISRVLTLLIVSTLFLPITKGRTTVRGKKLPPGCSIPRWSPFGFYGGFLQAGGIYDHGLPVSSGKAGARHRQHPQSISNALFHSARPWRFSRSRVIFRWMPGIVLAAGNALGAWVGVRANLRGGEKLIRISVAAAASIMAIILLW
jgi:uncharacterized membrane protein YfcA